jgi:hypothetical protein
MSRQTIRALGDNIRDASGGVKKNIGSWLPQGFSFLSGLPEKARRRRYLMPVQAFVDDSGGKGQSRHFVMAGLIAESEQWALFSDEWRACVDDHPRLRYFKMREAAACAGQFYGWGEADRDARLLRFARIINRYAKYVIYSAIDLDAHADTWARTMGKPHNEPYFWPFHNTITAACFELWDKGWREKFEIIFDEHVIFGPRAKLWYPVIREVVKLREPEESSIMPVDPMFRTDDEFLPLQACDLFAWCLRRGSDIGPNAERPFEWLLPELNRVFLSDYSQYYDRERLESVLQMSDEQAREIRAGLNPGAVEIYEKYKEMWR